MEKAWMIRNDGKIFPVLSHLYGNSEEVEETLYAAEWLYDSTKNNSTKNLIIKFIASWIDKTNHTDPISRPEMIMVEIDKRKYRILSKSFITKISEEIINASIEDLETLNDLIIKELNQEFLRARIGGIYNTSSTSGECYFRVSSIDFNWFNIIYQFVYNHKDIKYVTICRDEESTGSNEYYRHGSYIFNNLPIEEFLMIPGNPIVEKLDSLLETYSKMNYRRIIMKTDIKNSKEIMDWNIK